VMATVDLLRGLGPRGMDPTVVDGAETELRELYGECIDDPMAATAHLAAAVSALIAAFPSGIVDGARSDTARKAFRKGLKALQAAHQVRRSQPDSGLQGEPPRRLRGRGLRARLRGDDPRPGPAHPGAAAGAEPREDGLRGLCLRE
jgi:hypothetical protein